MPPSAAASAFLSARNSSGDRTSDDAPAPRRSLGRSSARDAPPQRRLETTSFGAPEVPIYPDQRPPRLSAEVRDEESTLWMRTTSLDEPWIEPAAAPPTLVPTAVAEPSSHASSSAAATSAGSAPQPRSSLDDREAAQRAMAQAAVLQQNAGATSTDGWKTTSASAPPPKRLSAGRQSV